MTEGRGWVVAGAILDLIGAVLIVAALTESGGSLAAGIAAMVIGSVLVVQGALRLSRSPGGADARPQAADLSAWQPEPELQQPVPRNVALTPAGKQMVVFWGLAILAAAGFYFYAPSRLGPSEQLLQGSGRRTAAVVHDKAVRETGGREAYYIYYNFQDEAGNGVRSSARVSQQVYDSIEIDGSIDVVYLPEDPFTHVLPAIAEPRVPARIALLAVGFVALLLAIFEAVRRHHRHLISRGAAAPGVVESVSGRGLRSAYVVRYTVNGETRRLRGSERQLRTSEGGIVTVLYKPEKTSQALIYRAALYRAVQGG